MQEREFRCDRGVEGAGGFGPLSAIATSWVVGIVVSCTTTHAWNWLAAALLGTFTVGLVGRILPKRAVWISVLLALVLWSAAWATLRREHVTRSHVLRHVLAEPTLARVTGIVDDVPTLRESQTGSFAAMSWAPPETRFTLRLLTIVRDGGERPCSGRLYVRLAEADHRIRAGDRIEATGWLSAVHGPQNPGEFNFRKLAAQRGIDARLTLVNRDNWRRLAFPNDRGLSVFRRHCREAAAYALRVGLPVETVRGREAAALLDAVVLGDRGADLAPWSESFRLAGLMHLLSISGAHLAILLGLTWTIGRMVFGHPRRTGMLVLVVLGLCLLIVPWRVPIVRAAVMATVMTAGTMTGRVTRPLEVVALAAWIVLIWQPADLFNPGFQLSFLCVLGLVLWTGRVSSAMLCPALAEETTPRWRRVAARRVATYVAANVVAYLLAMPLVAFHFKIITPYAPLFSLLAIPLLTVVLVLAYVKLLVGLVVPSVATWLAPPLVALSDLMQRGVGGATELPGAAIALTHGPSVGWTVAATLLLAWWLGHAGRWPWKVIATLFCATWLLLGQKIPSSPFAVPLGPDPRLRLHALAVGDGACYVVRMGGIAGAAEHVLMFDCGSLADLDMGRRTVVPALRALGIGRIDTLVLSHADLDHFCGVPEVMDEIPVSRVLVTPQLLREGGGSDDGIPGATSQLLRRIGQHEATVRPVARGWVEARGAALLHVLWPPADFAAQANDESIVLMVKVATDGDPRIRRLLLSGDVQGEAIRRLIARGTDLAADVADLPHHGSFVDVSPEWLGHVRPITVLQSCGRGRRSRDAWDALLIRAGVRRFDTATHGMIQWEVGGDGTMRWRTFLPHAAE